MIIYMYVSFYEISCFSGLIYYLILHPLESLLDLEPIASNLTRVETRFLEVWEVRITTYLKKMAESTFLIRN